MVKIKRKKERGEIVEAIPVPIDPYVDGGVQKKVREYIKNAEEALKRGAYGEALVIFDTAFNSGAEYPENQEARRKRASAYLGMADKKETSRQEKESLYKKALEDLKAARQEAIDATRGSAQSRDDAADSIMKFEKTVKDDFVDKVYSFTVKDALANKDYDGAVNAAEEAIGIHPEHAGIRNLKATALEKLGRYGEAHKELNLAIDYAHENEKAEYRAALRESKINDVLKSEACSGLSKDDIERILKGKPARRKKEMDEGVKKDIEYLKGAVGKLQEAKPQTAAQGPDDVYSIIKKALKAQEERVRIARNEDKGWHEWNPTNFDVLERAMGYVPKDELDKANERYAELDEKAGKAIGEHDSLVAERDEARKEVKELELDLMGADDSYISLGEKLDLADNSLRAKSEALRISSESLAATNKERDDILDRYSKVSDVLKIILEKDERAKELASEKSVSNTNELRKLRHEISGDLYSKLRELLGMPPIAAEKTTNEPVGQVPPETPKQ